MTSIAGHRLMIAVITITLGGCARPNCNEFAPPIDRVPTSCPAPAAKVAATPKGTHRKYCYATLGQTDCYDTPQPQIAPSFLGSYTN